MKHLGQHFLKNKSVAKRIVAALELVPGDTVIEIGPGHGELTEVLGQGSGIKGQAVKIVAIEKDRLLADELRKTFSGDKNLEIITGDALRLIPAIIHNSSFKIHGYKLVGNIPYYITGYLLRTIGELATKPSVSVLMMQKEVAERIVAQPPHMSRLAASVQFWAEPKILMHVPKNDFTPPPNVDSAIIALRSRTDADLARTDADTYYATVRTLFQQPRKTILNNLVATKRAKREIFEKNLIKMGIPPENRPQNLSVEDIQRIAQFLAS